MKLASFDWVRTTTAQLGFLFSIVPEYWFRKWCIISWSRILLNLYFSLLLIYLFSCGNSDTLYLCSLYRTQERQPMPSGGCLWPRLRGIWRMFWLINRPFLSHASAVVLDVLPRQRIGIQMDKDAGPSNLLSSF